MSIKHDTISLSSGKAEYVTASEVCWEVVWLNKLLSNLFEGPLRPTRINCDNKSCIILTKDPMFQVRKKHINNKYHYIISLI